MTFEPFKSPFEGLQNGTKIPKTRYVLM